MTIPETVDMTALDENHIAPRVAAAVSAAGLDPTTFPSGEAAIIGELSESMGTLAIGARVKGRTELRYLIAGLHGLLDAMSDSFDRPSPFEN